MGDILVYKNVTDKVTARTNRNIVVALGDVVCISLGDGHQYEYIANMPIWNTVDDDMKLSVESYIAYMHKKPHYNSHIKHNAIAMSCCSSGISVLHFEDLTYFEILFNSSNASEMVSIDSFPVQKTPMGYYIFVRTQINHGVYHITAADKDNGIIIERSSDENVIIAKHPDQTTTSPTFASISRAPHLPDSLAEYVHNAKERIAPRLLNCEFISSVIFALSRSIQDNSSTALLTRIGSILRGIPQDVVSSEFVQYLWSEICNRTTTHTMQWKDITPTKFDIDKLLYSVWLYDKNAYQSIQDRFRLKRNTFDPANKSEYFDRTKIGNPSTTLGNVLTWINNTIAYIVSGGNGFWITKNFDEHGNMYIEQLRDISKDLKHSCAIIIDTYGSDELKPKIYKLSDMVHSYKNFISFRKLIFMPYSGKENIPTSSYNHFNSFVGYPINYNKDLVVDTDILHPLLYHLRHVLADGDVLSFEYIVRWMAHIIQKPRKRTGVCLTFTSVQGAGKGIWWEWFGQRIIGINQYLFLDSIETLFQRFNSEQEGKLFTILDEAQLYSVQRKNNDRFKSVLTESTLRIEPKGLPVYTISNYNNFVMLTNQDLPTKVDISDRRHACFQVSNRHKGNKGYFEQLIECQYQQKVVEHFYHFLENLPLEGFEPQSCIPETQLKKDLKMASMPTPILFLIDLVRGNLIESDSIPLREQQFITTDYMYNLYRSWNGLNDGTAYDSKIQFSRVISNNLRIDQTRKRIDNILCRGYNMSVELLSDAIERHIGIDVV